MNARTGLLMLCAGCLIVACSAIGGRVEPYEIVADAIPAALTAEAGDARRGREVIAGRDGNCLLCHAIPETGERFMGNVGPPLSGVARRLTAGQLRLRIADAGRLNRDVIMPSYYRVHGLDRVAAAYAGKPILTAQQVEDVVAYLLTLR
jgi:sulfur-oxidizing protein SoxX